MFKLSLKPLIVLFVLCITGIIFSIVAIDNEIDSYIEEMKPEVVITINDTKANVDVKEDDNKINVIVNKEVEPNISNEPDEVEDVYIKVTSERGLNVRQEPTIESDRTDVLFYGEEVQVLEETDQWYRIEQGFIFKEYTIKI